MVERAKKAPTTGSLIGTQVSRGLTLSFLPERDKITGTGENQTFGPRIAQIYHSEGVYQINLEQVGDNDGGVVASERRREGDGWVKARQRSEASSPEHSATTSVRAPKALEGVSEANPRPRSVVCLSALGSSELGVEV